MKPIIVEDMEVDRTTVKLLLMDQEYLTTFYSAERERFWEVPVALDMTGLLAKPTVLTVVLIPKSDVTVLNTTWHSYDTKHHHMLSDIPHMVWSWTESDAGGYWTCLNVRSATSMVDLRRIMDEHRKIMITVLRHDCPVCHTDMTLTPYGLRCMCPIACDYCGVEVPNVETVRTTDEDWVCPDCRDSYYGTCGNCNEWVLCHDMTAVQTRDFSAETEDWCSYCVASDTHSCSVCGDVIVSDDLYEGSTSVCYHCAQNTEVCYECGYRYQTDEMNLIGDRNVCERCTARRYWWCERCDEYHHEDDVCENEYDEEEDEESSRLVHDHSYKPTLTYYNTPEERVRVKPKLYLGVELEVEPGEVGSNGDLSEVLNDSLGQDFVFCKHDGSLNTGGVELVTHPATLEYHRTLAPWGRILSDAVDCNYRSFKQANCGLHIHMSKKFLTDTEQIKLALLVYGAESEYQILAQRRSNNYSKFKKVKASKHLVQDEVEARDRYSALNYLNRYTIEFRMFKGTLCWDTILASMELVQVSCMVVKQHNTNEIVKSPWKLVREYVNTHRKEYAALANHMMRKGLLDRLESTKKIISRKEDIIKDQDQK
jgi:hypothetical protein